MNRYLNDLLRILETEDRLEALRFILDLMDQDNLSVQEIHEELLTPALNGMVPSGDVNMDIWKEHVRTSIIKSVIENLLPYVARERAAVSTPKGKTVAVLCPPEEYHDVGARMAADILTIHGYETIFVGGNTPLRVFEAGLATLPIDYVAISISNPYHLVSARNIIEGIRYKSPGVRIIVGGNAIEKLGERAEVLKADHFVHSLNDLKDLEGGVSHESRV